MAVNYGGNGGNDGGPVPAQMPEAARSRLPHPTRAPFLLAAHPLRWQYSAALDRWLPQLKTIPFEPGLGGVDKDGSADLARVAAMKGGWTVIPVDRVPASVPGGQYLRAFPVRNGFLHVSAWETPRAMGGTPVASLIDERGYQEWLAWLVDQRIVEPPTPEGVQRQLDAQSQTVSQLTAILRVSPGAAGELEEAKAMLAAMRRALDPKPAPAPASTSKSPKNLTNPDSE